MTDIKGLHIGSHVEYKFNKERVRVYGIDKSDGEGLPVIIGKSRSAVDPDEIEPIPLTAALLEELGFEPVRKTLGKHDEEWRMDLDGFPIAVSRGLSNHPGREWSVHVDSLDRDTLGAADVAYLHQLENIIYLCIGKELIKEDEV